MQEQCHETKRTNQFPLTFSNGTALMMVREDRQGPVMTAVSSKSGLVVSRCQNALPSSTLLPFPPPLYCFLFSVYYFYSWASSSIHLCSICLSMYLLPLVDQRCKCSRSPLWDELVCGAAHGCHFHGRRGDFNCLQDRLKLQLLQLRPHWAGADGWLGAEVAPFRIKQPSC